MTQRCANCPLNNDPAWNDIVCVALAKPHPPFCWAMDPTHAQRNPAFASVILKKSLEPAPNAKATCGSCVGQKAKMAAKLPAAVVVISHNYGRYLHDAVRSILGQTQAPSEILIIDDASTDDTHAVAAEYAIQHVRYLRGDWRHVHQAREAGLAATTAPAVCFLDADDRLPSDYLERGLPLLNDRRVGIVYSDIAYFGDRADKVSFPPFHDGRLEGENFIHAGSIVRREALQIADAFGGPAPPQAFADWHLWKKITRAGFIAAKSPASYQYRKHAGSMLLAAQELPYYAQANLKHEIITIFVPLAGRHTAWNSITRPWLESQTWPRAQCRLVLCDTSQDDAFGQRIRSWSNASGYPDVHYYRQAVGTPGLADQNRIETTADVRVAMKRIYSRMARNLDTPFVLTLEDDVRPPVNVVDRLLYDLGPKIGAISAPYRSRFANHFMVWDINGIALPEMTGPQEIGGSGFGCTLFRRDVLANETFVTEPGESEDYDITFAKRVRDKGWTWLADWDCQAEHLDSRTLLPVVEVVREPITVSVIIAAHNNGPFLRDAIESALNQRVPALEVIYSDDGSTDGSVDLARQYPEVQVLAQEPAGACAARNHAGRVARGSHLLHLDGDDILPRQYIEHRVAAANAHPKAAFVFGAAQAFGGDWNYYWDTPEWSFDRLWNGNYVNTSTLYRKTEFNRVGAWNETIGTAWDWDLALRMGAAGYPGVRDPNAFLLYRHHPTSHSNVCGFKSHTPTDAELRMKFLVRSSRCRLRVAAIVSGRLPELFPAWLQALRRNVQHRQERLTQETLFGRFGSFSLPAPRLDILYTGPASKLDTLRDQLDQVPELPVVAIEHAEWINQAATEQERRNNVASFLAQSYNKLAGSEELLWLVEDDVVPPDHALERMTRELIGHNHPRYAVSAVYRNRHLPEQYVASQWSDDQPAHIQTLTTLPAQPTFVDLTGTGCLLIFRPFAKHAFESHVLGIPAHDWRWCRDLRQYREDWHPREKQVLLLPDVVCRHYREHDQFV